MTKTRQNALVLILLSAGISIAWGISVAQNAYGWSDFKAVYYGARCLIQHSDPYNAGEFQRVYQAEGGVFPSDPVQSMMFRRAVLVFINVPTTLLLFAPLAMMAWGPAHVLWVLLLAASLILAAYLMWNLAEDYASGASLFLICLVLANCEFVFASGRTAGFAVGLCVIAVWCFIEERFVLAGILCLAVSMAIKPHDTGIIWLYFLLVGGVYRKRALQTLVVLVVLGLPAILWVTHVSPYWVEELHYNLSATAVRGGLGDPGPTSISMDSPGRIIDLQTVISVFRDDPRVYNPISYSVCGALFLVGAVRTLRVRFSQRSALLALAAIAALSMLPTYHRQYDAKLLLLTIPACAMLWAEGGPIGWIALFLNTAGILLTGDIPSAILVTLANHLKVCANGMSGKILTVMLLRPAPLFLLALGVFYLWVYLRSTGPELNQESEK